jgi:hypothetical protein
MHTRPWIKPLFLIGGLYDAVIGVAFLVFGNRIFAATGVEPPNHPGYVQFPALLLILFGVMFFRIAAEPVRCRDQMLYGIGLKLAYCGVIFGHWLASGVPAIWKPFAWADLAFLALFFVAWRATSPARRSESACASVRDDSP